MTDEPTQPTSTLEAALDYTRHGIAVLPVYWPGTLDPRGMGARSRTSPSPSMLACSCGAPDCQTPAEHPIKPTTIDDATVRVIIVTEWCQTHPYANLATVAGTSFDMIEVPYRGKTAPLVAWLAAQSIPPCPIIDTGQGRLQFPVRNPPPATALRSTDGAARRLEPGTLVLLPPSQHIDGATVTWRRPFDDRTLLLPDAARMLRVLAGLKQPKHSGPGSGNRSGSGASIQGTASGPARITTR